MLEASLRSNIIIAMDTGSGKTHIAVLRLKIESEREQTKACVFTLENDTHFDLRERYHGSWHLQLDFANNRGML